MSIASRVLTIFKSHPKGTDSETNVESPQPHAVDDEAASKLTESSQPALDVPANESSDETKEVRRERNSRCCFSPAPARYDVAWYFSVI